MKLYESAEDYLETILILQSKNGVVHAIDIAKEMNFSKPSVSIAMHKLEDNGYIGINKKGEIRLTESGAEIAKRIYDRHLTLTEILVKMGVPHDQAVIDACKIEHDLSEESYQALKKHFGIN